MFLLESQGQEFCYLWNKLMNECIRKVDLNMKKGTYCKATLSKRANGKPI